MLSFVSSDYRVMGFSQRHKMSMQCPRAALRAWEVIAGTERVYGRCLAEAKVQMSGMDPSGKRIKGQCGNCLTRNYISGKREIDDL